MLLVSYAQYHVTFKRFANLPLDARVDVLARLRESHPQAFGDLELALYAVIGRSLIAQRGIDGDTGATSQKKAG